MDVHRSIDIAAPAERVWPLLVDQASVQRWYGTLREFRFVDEQRGQGAHLHIVEQAGGPTIEGDFEATEWIPNRCLALHMTSGKGVAAYDQRWTIEPTGGGCRFSLSERVELPFGPVGRLIGIFAKRGSQAHLAKMLTTLKEMAEA